MPTVDGIYVPKGLEQIEELARLVAWDRRKVEKAELAKLYKQIHSHAYRNKFRRFSYTPSFRGWKRLGEYINEFEAGHILVSSGCGDRISTKLWTEVDLSYLTSLESYQGNVGLALLGRDLSLVTGGFVGIGKVNRYERRWSRITTDWRKIFYLIQLGQHDEFMMQFRGRRGLDQFLSRYFNVVRGGDRGIARSTVYDAIGPRVVEMLEWQYQVCYREGLAIYSTPYAEYALSRSQASGATQATSSTLGYGSMQFMAHGIPAIGRI